MSCPFGLDVHCSYGVQAGLRSSSMPGAVADIERSIDIWRTHFVPALKAGQSAVVLPRQLQQPEPRAEILSETPAILQRLWELQLCGPVSIPHQKSKPLFVVNRVLEPDNLRALVREKTGQELSAASDEQLIQRAVELYFGLPTRDAHLHAAVWAMYLRHRQHIREKKSAVPREGSQRDQKHKQQSSEVERFITRLLDLGIAVSYAYASRQDWVVHLHPAQEWTPALLRTRLQAYRTRFRAAPLTADAPEVSADALAAVEDVMSAMIRTWYELSLIHI